MKTKRILSVLALVVISLTSFTATAQKLVASKTHIKFFSTTPVEDIEANNYKTVGTLDKKTGKIVFSVPMQSFEFEKSLMQKHFNSADFLDTKTNPKAKLIGTIKDVATLNFEQNGSFDITVTGDLTINGVTKPIEEKATIKVEEGKVHLNAKFNVELKSNEIAFEKGKPSKNIAKVVEVTVEAIY